MLSTLSKYMSHKLWYQSPSNLCVTMTPSSKSPSPLLTSSSSSFHLHPSPSIHKSTSTKIDYLYEVSLLDDTQKISKTNLPLVNPYHAFVKKKNLLLLSVVLKLSLNNILVWPKNIFKLPFLTNIKFLLLLANSLLLSKFHLNF